MRVAGLVVGQWSYEYYVGFVGFILSGEYQSTSRVPRPHEYEYDVVIDRFCSWGLAFPPTR